jgi:ABC-type bacteriocin/lantibiotic exporter with double-glycine peptidase domain
MLFVPFLGLLMLSGVLVASWLILGPSAILAVVIVLTLMPLQLWSAKIVARLNRKRRKETGSRVQTMTEAIGSIKLVKMCVRIPCAPILA